MAYNKDEKSGYCCTHTHTDKIFPAILQRSNLVDEKNFDLCMFRIACDLILAYVTQLALFISLYHKKNVKK